jgi:hypothetical protein
MSDRHLALPSHQRLAPTHLPAASTPGTPAGGSQADAIRLREALRSLIDLSLLTHREIERRLVARGGGIDLARLLAGKCEIRVRPVLDILRVLEIHPLEFFRLIFREPRQRSALLQRVEAVFGPRAPAAPSPTPGPAAGDVESLHRRVESLQRELEQLSADLREMGQLKHPGARQSAR